MRRHRGTGRPLRGLRIFPDGTAIDVTVDLSIARGLRSYADMRAVLHLSPEPAPATSMVRPKR